MDLKIDPEDRAVVVGLMASHYRAWHEKNRQQKIADAATAAVKELNNKIGDIESGLRGMGFDVSKDGVWKALVNEIRGDLRDRVGLRSAPQTTALAIEHQPQESLSTPPAPKVPKVQDLLLERLKEAGEKGSKALPMRQSIEDKYRIKLHDKTVGMTLYRMLQRNLVRRDGHIWFFVPQETAETKKPGELPPGLLEMLK